MTSVPTSSDTLKILEALNGFSAKMAEEAQKRVDSWQEKYLNKDAEVPESEFGAWQARVESWDAFVSAYAKAAGLDADASATVDSYIAALLAWTRKPMVPAKSAATSVPTSSDPLKILEALTAFSATMAEEAQKRVDGWEEKYLNKDFDIPKVEYDIWRARVESWEVFVATYAKAAGLDAGTSAIVDRYIAALLAWTRTLKPGS